MQKTPATKTRDDEKLDAAYRTLSAEKRKHVLSPRHLGQLLLMHGSTDASDPAAVKAAVEKHIAGIGKAGAR